MECYEMLYPTKGTFARRLDYFGRPLISGNRAIYRRARRLSRPKCVQWKANCFRAVQISGAMSGGNVRRNAYMVVEGCVAKLKVSASNWGGVADVLNRFGYFAIAWPSLWHPLAGTWEVCRRTGRYPLERTGRQKKQHLGSPKEMRLGLSALPGKIFLVALIRYRLC